MPLRPPAGFIRPGFDPLKNPNAPTIGTATTVSDTSLTITFTAPSNVGGSAITSYLAVAKRTSDGVTFTTSGTSSPITITGLTAVPFTATVVAVNSYGPSASSAASNSITPAVPPPTVIGQAYGGGYYAGKISLTANGVATHYLVVSDASVGQSSGAWGPTGTVTGVTSIIDGPANTSTLAALGASYAAATFCQDLNTGGYTDWYLPAKDELAVIYYFLKPGTATNNTSPPSGSTAYAVSPQPISTAYTSGSPAQTSATNFVVGAGLQEFSQGLYNTSTEFDADYKWLETFDNGYQRNTLLKTRSDFTRAIRRVPV